MYMFLGMLKIIWNSPADRSWSETILHKLHFFYCKLLIFKKKIQFKELENQGIPINLYKKPKVCVIYSKN